ncbi:hypothetical protein [Acinetobacter baumannii]|uniref:hypothetical protein n=1 Tax=Acinetobacter baumannii TaxID=470 RepID=UPI003F8585DE
MTQPPVDQQERRHGFRRAGAIESPSGRHQKRLSCNCRCQDHLAPACCGNRLNATAAPPEK